MKGTFKYEKEDDGKFIYNEEGEVRGCITYKYTLKGNNYLVYFYVRYVPAQCGMKMVYDFSIYRNNASLHNPSHLEEEFAEVFTNDLKELMYKQRGAGTLIATSRVGTILNAMLHSAGWEYTTPTQNPNYSEDRFVQVHTLSVHNRMPEGFEPEEE